MLASTIQFTTNPPTPTQNPKKWNPGRAGQTRAHCPRTPTACHPHTHTSTHRGTHQTPHPHTKQEAEAKQACFLHQAPGNQPPHTTVHDGTVTQPSVRASTPDWPGPINSPSKINSQEATPTQLPILRKEVIQPHLPVRLPCYDFVPIANPTFDHSPR